MIGEHYANLQNLWPRSESSRPILPQLRTSSRSIYLSHSRQPASNPEPRSTIPGTDTTLCRTSRWRDDADGQHFNADLFLSWRTTLHVDFPSLYQEDAVDYFAIFFSGHHTWFNHDHLVDLDAGVHVFSLVLTFTIAWWFRRLFERGTKFRVFFFACSGKTYVRYRTLTFSFSTC